jgi:hypothetical protein
MIDTHSELRMPGSRLKHLCLALVFPTLWIAFAVQREDRYLDPGTGPFYAVLIVVRAVLFCALAAGCYTVLRQRRAIVASIAAQRTAVAYCAVLFVALAAYHLVWLLGLWPGLLMSDTLATVRRVQSLRIDNWFSYLHPLLWLGLYQIWPNIAVIGLFQIAITATMLVYLAMTLQRTGGAVVAAIAVALSLVSIPIIVNTAFFTRDTAFGVAHMALALYVFNMIVRQRGLGRPAMAANVTIFLTLAASFLALYRGEGIFAAIALPFLLAGFGVATTRRAAAMLAAIVLIYATLGIGVQKTVFRDQAREYTLVLLLNPLGFVMQHDYWSKDKAEDAAIIDQVVDVELVRNISNPYEVPVYWAGGARRGASDAAFDAFVTRAKGILADNLHYFAAGRMATFLASAGFSPSAVLYADYVRTTIDYPEAVWRTISRTPLSQTMRDWMLGVIETASHYNGLSLSGMVLHWNLLPGFVLVVVSACLFRLLPATAAAAMLIGSRVPFIVLMAPASQFKYFYSLYLFGLFGILLAVGEFCAYRVSAVARADGARHGIVEP